MLLSRHTRRRHFIALLGAAAWPLAARAQQAAMPVVDRLPSLMADLVPPSRGRYRR
jgi:hypothetical protein